MKQRLKFLFYGILMFGWLALSIYARFTGDELPWQNMFSLTCFLLFIANAKFIFYEAMLD